MDRSSKFVWEEGELELLDETSDAGNPFHKGKGDPEGGQFTTGGSGGGGSAASKMKLNQKANLARAIKGEGSESWLKSEGTKLLRQFSPGQKFSYASGTYELTSQGLTPVIAGKSAGKATALNYVSPNTKNFSGDEKDAITSYSARSYEDINNILRGTKPSKDRVKEGATQPAAIKANKEQIVLLDSAMDKSPVPKDTTIYRALNSHGVDMKVGTVIDDKGYTSFSKDKGSVSDFAQSYGKSAIIQTSLSKGSKAIEVDSELSDNPEEAEVILPRGSSFKITGVGRSIEGIPVYKAEIVKTK